MGSSGSGTFIPNITYYILQGSKGNVKDNKDMISSFRHDSNFPSLNIRIDIEERRPIFLHSVQNFYVPCRPTRP